jgi:WD40 repeat protein
MALEAKHRIVGCPLAERGQNLHLGYDSKNKDKICYPSRAGIVVRSLSDATDSDVYNGFRGVANTTVAKFSPSGYYLACGGTDGHLHIVASKRNEEGDFIQRAQYEVLSGPIKDIAWSMDNDRCLVVGDGKESFTRALLVNSGATVGDIGGHSGRVQSVDFKPSRPFRAITGSEDQKTNFYAGPPFKFGHSTEIHTGNVNCVRYNHKGSLYCTIGSDKQGFLFDGKEGKQVGVMGPEGMHTATIYTCSWSPDDSMILTTSADKTTKVWAVGEDNNATLVTTFAFQDAKNRLNMMCGGVWADSCLVTSNLNGDVFQLQQGQPDPVKVYRGHHNYISGMAVNAANGELVCCDGSGRIISWDVPAAMGEEVKAEKPPAIFTCCAVSPSAPTAFLGTGDMRVMLADLASNTVGGDVKLAKVCRAICTTPVAATAAYCITSETLHVLAAADGAVSIVQSYPIDEPTALAISPCGGFLVVGTKAGGARGGGKLIVYPATADAVAMDSAVELESPHAAEITAITFSSDSSLLATGDKRSAGGNIALWDFNAGAPALKSEGWVYHTAAVSDLSFSPDGAWLCSASNDASVILFSVDGSKRQQYPNLHESEITGVTWLSDTSVVTTGNDGQLRTFEFKA